MQQKSWERPEGKQKTVYEQCGSVAVSRIRVRLQHAHTITMDNDRPATV